MRNRPMTRYFVLLIFLFFILITSMLVSLSIGAVDIPPSQILFILTHPRTASNEIRTANQASGTTHTSAVILLQLRLPRVLTAVLVGACLSLAGAIFQGLLRNPLAEPFILGVSSGAALGVTFGMFLALPVALGLYTVPLFASLGAALAMAVVYRLACIGARLSVFNLIISGVIVNAVASALIMFMVSIMERELHGVLFWLMGRLDTTTMGTLRILTIAVAVVFSAAIYFSRDLNLLTLGEEDAFHLGVNVERVKRLLFFAGSILTGCAVAAGGIVGFVGLIVPHGARALVGPDNRFLFPASMLLGAILMVTADIAARTASSPSEIPVGVITALLGGPFFLVVLKRKSGLVWSGRRD
ncbi:MAG: iron ABC transporter permease [bacterium]